MKTTVRPLLLGALFAVLAACASQGVSPTDRAWMQAALDAPADDVPAEDSARLALAEGRVVVGPVAPLVLRTIERPNDYPRDSRVPQSKQDKSGGALQGAAPSRPDERWERRNEAGEIAIMERHLAGKKQFYAEGFERRPFGVTAFVQLDFPFQDNATDGLSPEADWDDLLEDGLGYGLELSYKVVPFFEPLIGVKYTTYNDARNSIRNGAAVIEQKHEGLDTIPIYGGFRLNFPLSMPTEEWFSTRHAGLSYGVIPFIKVGAGGAFILGTELTLTDQATRVSNKFDFIDRGFVGYAEAAIGLEYRSKGGFAMRFSVGVERYFGLDLAGPAKTAFPGTDLEDLGQAVLPRLSASFYF